MELRRPQRPSSGVHPRAGSIPALAGRQPKHRLYPRQRAAHRDGRNESVWMLWKRLRRDEGFCCEGGAGGDMRVTVPERQQTPKERLQC